MTPLEHETRALAIQQPESTQLTPFNIREQLLELIDGPGSFKDRIIKLLRTSQSPYKLRERFLALLDESPAEEIGLRTVSIALQEKLDKEEKTGGFHLGIISDGNRRWAKEHGLDKTMGHKRGAEIIEDVIFPTVSSVPQISELSIYLLSNANLGREERELENLYSLFRIKYDNLIRIAEKHNVRYKHAGSKEDLPKDLQKLLADLEAETARNDGKVINLCINYSAMEESGAAIKRFASSLSNEEIDDMTPQEIARQVQENSWISTPTDVVLRTGGDPRFSGFAGNRPFDPDCQLIVEQKFLPDLTEQDIFRHLLSFAKGERRMGH